MWWQLLFTAATLCFVHYLCHLSNTDFVQKLVFSHYPSSQVCVVVAIVLVCVQHRRSTTTCSYLITRPTTGWDLFLRSQVVYSKQPKLGLTQEFVVLLVRMRLVVCMFVCLFVCLFVITCLFVLQAI